MVTGCHLPRAAGHGPDPTPPAGVGTGERSSGDWARLQAGGNPKLVKWLETLRGEVQEGCGVCGNTLRPAAPFRGRTEPATVASRCSQRQFSDHLSRLGRLPPVPQLLRAWRQRRCLCSPPGTASPGTRDTEPTRPSELAPGGGLENTHPMGRVVIADAHGIAQDAGKGGKQEPSQEKHQMLRG